MSKAQRVIFLCTEEEAKYIEKTIDSAKQVFNCHDGRALIELCRLYNEFTKETVHG